MLFKILSKNQKVYLKGFLGSFLGIAALGVFHDKILSVNIMNHLFLTGAFGATAVLIFSETQSPLAQPRNLFVGHLLSAFIGVSIFKVFGQTLWFSSALSVALAISVMRAASAQHPPGGATALIANIGGEQIHELGYKYVFQPVLGSIFLLFIIALFVNNLIDYGSYPNDFEKYKQFLKKYFARK